MMKSGEHFGLKKFVAVFSVCLQFTTQYKRRGNQDQNGSLVVDHSKEHERYFHHYFRIFPCQLWRRIQNRDTGSRYEWKSGQLFFDRKINLLNFKIGLKVRQQ